MDFGQSHERSRFLSPTRRTGRMTQCTTPRLLLRIPGWHKRGFLAVDFFDWQVARAEIRSLLDIERTMFLALQLRLPSIAFHIHSARLSPRISQYPSSKVGSFALEQHLQKQDHLVTQAQDLHVRSRIVQVIKYLSVSEKNSRRTYCVTKEFPILLVNNFARI